MTHAEYVAQGYPEIYAVSDVYKETDGLFYVDVYDWSNPKGKAVVERKGFESTIHAHYFRGKKDDEIAEWEVEVNEDDPQAEYGHTEMAALKARTR